MNIPFSKFLGKLFNVQFAEKVQLAEEIKSLKLHTELNKIEHNANFSVDGNNNITLVNCTLNMPEQLKDGAEERLSAAVGKYLEANLAKRFGELKNPDVLKVANMIVNTSASAAISSMEYIKGNKTYQDSFLDD